MPYGYPDLSCYSIRLVQVTGSISLLRLLQYDAIRGFLASQLVRIYVGRFAPRS